MVNSQHAALDATFAALPDPTRRAILARLATEDLRQRHEMGWTKCFEKLSALMERR